MIQTTQKAPGDSSARLRFINTSNSLHALQGLPALIKKDLEEARQLARKFNDEVVRSIYREIDKRVMEDEDYLPLDFIIKANEWRLYSRWIPKMYGGQGMNMLSLYAFIEEVSSVCAGLANLIGVHYLGVSVLCSSCNLKITNRILRDVVSEEKKGNPCIISLAWTEPGAGTDQVEGLLLDRAKVRTSAVRVAGGYVVNGSKVFISGGHLSTWHMLLCYEDVKKPAETLIMLAIKTGMKGFSFGHKELKMGQKACVASELIFEDCFVPSDRVCYCKEHVAGLGISVKEANLRLIGMFPPVSQPGVAAIATGVARAACEAAVNYAAQKKVAGEYLINQEWAQMLIADMYSNVLTARNAYMEAAYAVGLRSMIKMLFQKPMFYLSRYLPDWVFTKLVSPLFDLEIVNRIFRKMNFVVTNDEDERNVSGFGSLCKISCSDIAMLNCNMAMDLMGADGTRHDAGVEKLLRDAKLLQIYEGTNEANRINLFSMHIAQDMPGVRVFE